MQVEVDAGSSWNHGIIDAVKEEIRKR